MIDKNKNEKLKSNNKKDEYVELEIIDLDDNARGVSRKDGLIYFVEDAVLGETVIAKIKKRKKSYIISKKIKTINESPFLSDFNISKSNLCGIYDLYNIDYERQVLFKKDMILSSLNRIAKLNLDDIDFVSADKNYGYRNKIELKLSYNGNLSYFERSSNSFINIDNCIMASKEINEMINDLKVIIKDYSIKGYDPNKDIGVIKNVILRSTSTGEKMCILVLNKKEDYDDLIRILLSNKFCDSFYISVNNKKRNYKIDNLEHIYGKEKIQEIMGEYKFNISPKAFFQVNTNMAYTIYLKARDLVTKINPSYIVDLYSGVSTTSIILSDLCEKIVSVEINSESISDAKENAKLNGIENIEWINKPAEEVIDNIDLNQENTTLLVDPPRSGLDQNIIETISKSNINNIIYISCNPSTLARDIKRFREYNFNVDEVTGYDQFVNTIHVEALVLMTRKNKQF